VLVCIAQESNPIEINSVKMLAVMTISVLTAKRIMKMNRPREISEQITSNTVSQLHICKSQLIT
jgi:hypothetical protein